MIGMMISERDLYTKGRPYLPHDRQGFVGMEITQQHLQKGLPGIENAEPREAFKELHEAPICLLWPLTCLFQVLASYGC